MAKAISLTVRSRPSDLLELWLYIAEDNIAVADNVIGAIHRAAMLLADQPAIGRSRPELAPDMYSFPTRTPYILFYVRNKAGGITVARVLHHARDPEAIGHWPSSVQ